MRDVGTCGLTAEARWPGALRPSRLRRRSPVALTAALAAPRRRPHGRRGRPLPPRPGGSVIGWARTASASMGDGTTTGAQHAVFDRRHRGSRYTRSSQWRRQLALTKTGRVYCLGRNLFARRATARLPCGCGRCGQPSKRPEGEACAREATGHGDSPARAGFWRGVKNTDGELGDGSTKETADPGVRIRQGSHVTASAPAKHALALTRSGRVGLGRKNVPGNSKRKTRRTGHCRCTSGARAHEGHLDRGRYGAGYAVKSPAAVAGIQRMRRARETHPKAG